ncbi:MAG: hypothetical protein GWO24_31265, partial [Akkermansiaceae bacterium]|nr:hypothetical protein [Akkermansiaceae bacterium]
ELYRIDDEWWFTDSWGRRPSDANWGYKGTEEPERYHSEWMKRSREAEYDYSSFVGFVRAVNDNRFPRELMEQMCDIDMMAANAMVRGWISDWDNITRRRGKNGYQLRRKSDGKWMLVQWDSDLTFGNTGDPIVEHGLTRGFFLDYYVKRRCNYFLGEMLDKYTNEGNTLSPRLGTWISLEERASGEYSSNSWKFQNWNNSRRSVAQSYIGTAWSTRFSVSGNTSTSQDIVNLSGSGGYKVYSVRCVDHPEAVLDWPRETAWSLKGIQLHEGENELTF